VVRAMSWEHLPQAMPDGTIQRAGSPAERAMVPKSRWQCRISRPRARAVAASIRPGIADRLVPGLLTQRLPGDVSSTTELNIRRSRATAGTDDLRPTAQHNPVQHQPIVIGDRLTQVGRLLSR
jgi:hypothetical protein